MKMFKTTLATQTQNHQRERLVYILIKALEEIVKHKWGEEVSVCLKPLNNEYMLYLKV